MRSLESPGIGSTMPSCYRTALWSLWASPPSWQHPSTLTPPRGSSCSGWSWVLWVSASSSCLCYLWSKRNGRRTSSHAFLSFSFFFFSNMRFLTSCVSGFSFKQKERKDRRGGHRSGDPAQNHGKRCREWRCLQPVFHRGWAVHRDVKCLCVESLPCQQWEGKAAQCGLSIHTFCLWL